MFNLDVALRGRKRKGRKGEKGRIRDKGQRDKGRRKGEKGRKDNER